MILGIFPAPHIYEYDTLTSQERWNEFADVMLANPPFMSPKGGIKPHKRFSIQAKRSEVFFVDYMAEHLTPQGRAINLSAFGREAGIWVERGFLDLLEAGGTPALPFWKSVAARCIPNKSPCFRGKQGLDVTDNRASVADNGANAAANGAITEFPARVSFIH